MTGPWAALLATFTNFESTGPIHFLDPGVPAAAAHVRVGWDPETRTWGAFPSSDSDGAAPASAAERLGGAELPFQPEVEFTLPGGGGGVLMGRRGLEWVTVTRGKDGRFHFDCAPAPAVPSPPAPTDR